MMLADLLGRGTDMISRSGSEKTSNENFKESNKKSKKRIHLFIFYLVLKIASNNRLGITKC